MKLLTSVQILSKKNSIISSIPLFMGLSDFRLWSLITANHLRLFHFGGWLRHLSVPFTMHLLCMSAGMRTGERGTGITGCVNVGH